MKKNSTFLLIIFFTLSICSIKAQIPNNGFENWANDNDGEFNPVGWTSTNADPYVSTTQYTPAYAGNYSMKVSVMNLGFGVIPGVAQAEFPYTSRPTKLNVCLKTNVVPGDLVYVVFALLRGDTVIAGSADCTYAIDSTIEEFTCMSLTVAYTSEYYPTTANIMIIAGDQSPAADTYIVVDEIAFDLTSGIDTFSDSEPIIANYPNPAKDYTIIPLNLNIASDVDMYISDVTGKIVQSIPFHALSSGRNELRINTEEMPNGIYFYTVKSKDIYLSGKMMVVK